jgi:hypothetical protein
MAIEEAPTIARLVDVAARLREVRRAQRRFLRRWAQERSDRWLAAIAQSAERTQFAASRFRRQLRQGERLPDDHQD